MAAGRNVEDIHRLSELQEALLVHRLRDQGADSGVLLVRGRLLGPLDARRLRQAWQDTVARHPALRSSVHWRGLKHPVQVVAKQVEVEIESEDWRGLDTDEQESRLEARIERFRHGGLDISKPPVMKVSIVHLSDGEHLLLWACHHLLLDGWSSTLVLGEVLAREAALAEGQPFAAPTPPPFRDYVTATRKRGEANLAEYWRLLGCSARDVLASPRLGVSGRGAHPRRWVTRILPTPRAELEAWARGHRLTLGALLLGAWTAALAATTGGDRVTLGLTSSGRADLEGGESMVGMFAGVLPLTFSVLPEATPVEWIRGLFERQQSLHAFESSPLHRLFEAGGVTLRRPPFETLLALATFPAVRDAGGPGLRLVDFRGDLTSSFPLTVAVLPEKEVRIEAFFDPDALDAELASRLIEHFAAAAEAIVGGAGTVHELLDGPAGGLAQATARPAAALRPLGGTGAEAAATATEAHLMRIWNDLITVQEYGRDDNFFELGGHSLLVAQMIERIEQDFGVRLPLGIVFEKATLRALAAAIEADGEHRDWAPLVPIRPEGEAPPLFMVHGLGGEVGWFYDLANYLDPSVPLFGLQAPAEPGEHLVKMASLYLDSVRSFPPPYRLGGYCVGGGVAFEMARQLEAAGQEVSALILIDSVPHAHIAGQTGPTPRQLKDRLGRLMSKEPQEIVRSTRDFALRATRRLGRALPGADSDAPLELDDVLDMSTLPQVYHEASRRHFRAMRDYEPGPYGGDAWLLRTDEDRFGEDFGWGGLVRGKLTVERVPGRHVDVLKEPHVEVVGRRLSEALLAQGRGP